jgi:phospho-N-acetylmuramoyl-pentapeptide-transferase
VPFLIFSHRTVPAVTAFFVALGCAAIGFVDDWTKVSRRRSLGLSGRWKLLWLGAITIVVGFVAARGLDEPLTTDVYLPLLDVDLPLGWGWYVLLYFIIAGFANGVNLTDGIDGLAAGTTTISLLTYTAMSLVAALASIRAVGAADQVDLDLAILGASLIGASIGFLWYNAFPAQVFMGDTGSMGLGGAIAAFAIMTKTESLLILIGGIFVIEALSVIVQVVSFKWFGRRVLLMAPLHHHFEMKAWSETRITVRFWIITALLCACGFVLYYRYASEFAS